MADILALVGGSEEEWAVSVKSVWTEMLSGVEGEPAEVKFTKEEFVLLAGRSVAFVAEEEVDAVFEGTDEEVGAAAKIQAMHRGKKTRADMQTKKEMEAASVKIQANFRGKIVRGEREKQEQSAAAVKIQAVHRGKKSRKGDAGAAGAGEADTIESIAETREDVAAQTASATKIQAMQRGKKDRARVAGLNAGLKIQFVIMPENFTYELECPVSGSCLYFEACLVLCFRCRLPSTRVD